MSILIYIVFCVLVGYYAGRRGRSSILWFLAALLISPILSAIILAILRDLTIDREIRRNSMETDRMRERVAVSEANLHARMDHMERRMDRMDGGGPAVIDSPAPAVLPAGAAQWKYCPQCGAQAALDAIFCPSCGSRMPDIRLIECPYCHHQVRSDAGSCPYCKHDLD